MEKTEIEANLDQARGELTTLITEADEANTAAKTAGYETEENYDDFDTAKTA